MKKHLGLGLATLAAFALAACSGSSKQDVENDTNATALENQGTFKSDCQNIPLNILNLNAATVQYNITGHIEKITTYYATNDCQNPVLTIDETGDYSHVGPTQLPSAPNAVDIDIAWGHTNITPSPAATSLIAVMNAVPGGYCGVTDWAVNTERNVDPASGSLTCLGTDKLATVYDIMSTQNGNLQFGQLTPTTDKTTPAERPTVLDPAIVAHKQ